MECFMLEPKQKAAYLDLLAEFHFLFCRQQGQFTYFS